MDFQLNHGIVKKSKGNRSPFVIKDLSNGNEFPVNKILMTIHGMSEGDLVEFSGSIHGGLTYLAISCVEFKLSLN